MGDRSAHERRLTSPSVLFDQVQTDIEAATDEQLARIRANLRTAFHSRYADAGNALTRLSVFTGLGANTIRGFLFRDTDSSIRNVMLIARACNVDLASLCLSADEFERTLTQEN